MTRGYCLTSAAIFVIVALMHLWRVVLDLPMQLGAWSVPRSVSFVAALGAAAMAVWALKSAQTAKPPRVAYT